MSKTAEGSYCAIRHNGAILSAVKYKMDQLGISQVKLSEETGVPKYRISLYLTGKRINLNQVQLFKVCDYLGIKVDINVSLL